VHFYYFPEIHSIDFILTFVPYIFYYMYNEQNTTKAAQTRLQNLASTEWVLPEDDALALKYLGAINKEQFSKNCQSSVHLFVHYTHSIDSVSWLPPLF